METMATCEICGEPGDLKKTKVEGTTLDLCDDCQDLGEAIGSNQPKTRKKPSKPRSRPNRREPDTNLVEDFGTRVKHARESKELSVTDLATKIKEKDSVIRRVETGKLSPDRKLARKLESALGITLYDTLSGTTHPTGETGDTGEQTLGDVAEVRDRS